MPVTGSIAGVADSNREQVVHVRDLAKTFGTGSKAVQALRGVDLEVGAGECVALLGANGSGKSTTLKLVLGLLRPTRGDATAFHGRAGRRAARARTGYVPEEARRFGRLTGRETVDLFLRLQARMRRGERRTRVDDALETVGLDRRAWDQRVNGYSRGMARRLAVAAAWVHRPDLLVLDEPTSGLDPIGTEDIHAVLRRHREAGGAILLSTHDRVSVEGVADRAVVLHAGRVARAGTPAALFEDDPSPSLLRLIERAARD